jgi:putative ABC transport system substrate-binding protein
VAGEVGGNLVGVFRQGMRDLGYVEGKDIVIEFRSAEGHPDRISGLVDEVLKLNPDVLVTANAVAIRAAKQATKTIPIVMMSTMDPVATGIIDSLAQPGGNITGVTRLSRELSGKRLELLKEVAPKTSRVGIFWHTETESAKLGFREYETAARALRMQIISLGLSGEENDLNDVFQNALKRRTAAFVAVRNPVTQRLAAQIAELSIKNRLPSMGEGSDYANKGGLLSYTTNEPENFRRAAVYVDKILKGAKPADLPVEQPTKFELVINLTTAKQIGLTIPPNVLARADRVIR